MTAIRNARLIGLAGQPAEGFAQRRRGRRALSGRHQLGLHFELQMRQIRADCALPFIRFVLQAQ